MERVDKLYGNDNDSYSKCNVKHFKEIKYFHPEGKSMPNAVYSARGGFINECVANEKKFTLSESLHDDQYGLENYKGGVIVFSTDVNAVRLDSNDFANKVKQTIATFKQRYFKGSIIHKALYKFNKYNPQDERVGGYSIGNIFKGHYIGGNGENYDEKSLSIEIGGLSSSVLLYLAEYIARIFKQETVLVKDLNNNKIYYANGLRSNDKPDFTKVNQKV